MTDAFTVLEADHTEVETLLTRLLGGPGPVSGASQDPAGDVEQLVVAESGHEAAEEMYLWPVVRQRVTGGDDLADEASRQEREGKRVLDRLRKCRPGDPEFDRLVTAFAATGRAHIAYEEDQVWPKLRAVLGDGEAEEMGERLAAARAAGPTRPHPAAPDGPAGLKTAGTAAAVLDRLRDAVVGRPRSRRW